MARTPLLIAAAVAAAALTGAVLATTGGAQSSSTTIHLFEPDAGAFFSVVDEPPLSHTHNPQSSAFRYSAGDRQLFRSRLLDARGGTKQGTIYGELTVIRGHTLKKASYLMRGTMQLPTGQLVLAGAYGPGSTRTVAVVGGTDAYAGARGTLTNTDAGDDTVVLQP